MLSVFDKCYLHVILDRSSSSLRSGIPAHGAFANNFMALSREEQYKGCFSVKRAPALLCPYFQAFVVPMRACFGCKKYPYERTNPAARFVVYVSFVERVWSFVYLPVRLDSLRRGRPPFDCVVRPTMLVNLLSFSCGTFCHNWDRIQVGHD